MTQVQREQSVYLIDGYFNPRPHERIDKDLEPAFDRAKQECIKNYEIALKNLKEIDFNTFKAVNRIK